MSHLNTVKSSSTARNWITLIGALAVAIAFAITTAGPAAAAVAFPQAQPPNQSLDPLGSTPLQDREQTAPTSDDKALLGGTRLGESADDPIADSDAAADRRLKAFGRSSMKRVGRLYMFGQYDDQTKVCSGTIVDTDLVLTAGHCLWGNYGADRDSNTRPRAIAFIPGSQSAGFGFLTTPYGVWSAKRTFVMPAYKHGNSQTDWAFVQIKAKNGQMIGKKLGTYPIVVNKSWRKGTRTIITGYPAAGYFGTEAAGFGNNQYTCRGTVDYANVVVKSGTQHWAQCPMTPGVSGGPWFIRHNGAWYVGGVTNWCWRHDGDAHCAPKAEFTGTANFDTRMMDFFKYARRAAS